MSRYKLLNLYREYGWNHESNTRSSLLLGMRVFFIWILLRQRKGYEYLRAIFREGDKGESLLMQSKYLPPWSSISECRVTYTVDAAIKRS